jgi:hypothetical protein
MSKEENEKHPAEYWVDAYRKPSPDSFWQQYRETVGETLRLKGETEAIKRKTAALQEESKREIAELHKAHQRRIQAQHDADQEKRDEMLVGMAEIADESLELDQLREERVEHLLNEVADLKAMVEAIVSVFLLPKVVETLSTALPQIAETAGALKKAASRLALPKRRKVIRDDKGDILETVEIPVEESK